MISTTQEILRVCREYSMIGDSRMLFNVNSVEATELNHVEGDIVEIGVWKGGSILSSNTRPTIRPIDVFIYTIRSQA